MKLKDLPASEIIQDYKKNTIDQISKKYGCSHDTIGRLLRLNNQEIRKGGPPKNNIPWNKGKKCPQISRGMRGHISWNKGKKCPQISLALRGKPSKRKLPLERKNCLFCKNVFYSKKSKKRKFCKEECFDKYQKTEEYKASQREKNYLNATKIKESTPEKFFSEILKANNIPYKKGNKITGNPDFIIKNICIFIDGEYWHEYPNLRKLDIENNKSLEFLGFKVIRFWAIHDLYRDPTSCINKVIASLGVEPSNSGL